MHSEFARKNRDLMLRFFNAAKDLNPRATDYRYGLSHYIDKYGLTQPRPLGAVTEAADEMMKIERTFKDEDATLAMSDADAVADLRQDDVMAAAIDTIQTIDSHSAALEIQRQKLEATSRAIGAQKTELQRRVENTG